MNQWFDYLKDNQIDSDIQPADSIVAMCHRIDNCFADGFYFMGEF